MAFWPSGPPAGTAGQLPGRSPSGERGFLAERTFPARDQPGEGVNPEGGVPEPAAVQRHIGKSPTCSWLGLLVGTVRTSAPPAPSAATAMAITGRSKGNH